MKKCISFFLTVCLIASICALAPISASAAASGTCGEHLTWTLDDEGVLTISGEGKMFDYDYDSIPFVYGTTTIKTVIIKDGVTSIGSSVFSDCNSLTSVTIPDSVTSIGDGAFYCCDNLKNINVSPQNNTYSSIDGVVFNKNKTTLLRCPGGRIGTYAIPDGVTSIGDWAFDSCSSLTSVTIPDSVTSIGWSAFFECDSLETIYYTGSETDWEKITSSTYPGDFANVTIHYNAKPNDNTARDKMLATLQRFTEIISQSKHVNATEVHQ